MPSTWPLAFDASFPGYPYQDEIEYITGEQANAWVQAIQALEQGLGYGTATSASNPLYSSVNNEYYSTLAARLTAIETTHESAVGIDSAAGDIQPVGSSGSGGGVAVAGNKGLAADAGHVHPGVTKFQNRQGNVSLLLADIFALLTSAGVLVGAPGGGSFLGIGAANSVLQVDPTGTFLQFGATGSSTAGSGDTKFTSAIAIPGGWLAANGAAVSRTTYSSLLAATTISQSLTVSNGTETISGISSSLTAYMAIGMPIEIPGYLPSGTTITGVGGTSITVSNNTTNGGTATFTVFPYGNGNGSTTFNVIDLRGRVPVGNAGPGGNGQPGYAMGVSGGEWQHTLAVSEMPSHTHTDSGHSHAYYTPDGETSSQGIPENYISYFTYVYAVAVVAGDTTGISYANLSNIGGSAGHNNMQPFVAGQWLVKT